MNRDVVGIRLEEDAVRRALVGLRFAQLSAASIWKCKRLAF